MESDLGAPLDRPLLAEVAGVSHHDHRAPPPLPSSPPPPPRFSSLRLHSLPGGEGVEEKERGGGEKERGGGGG